MTEKSDRWKSREWVMAPRNQVAATRRQQRGTKLRRHLGARETNRKEVSADYEMLDGARERKENHVD